MHKHTLPHVTSIQQWPKSRPLDRAQWLEVFKTESLIAKPLKLPPRNKYPYRTWERWAAYCMLTESIFTKNFVFLRDIEDNDPLLIPFCEQGDRMVDHVLSVYDEEIQTLPANPTKNRGMNYVYMHSQAQFLWKMLVAQQNDPKADALAVKVERLLRQILNAYDITKRLYSLGHDPNSLPMGPSIVESMEELIPGVRNSLQQLEGRAQAQKRAQEQQRQQESQN